MWSCAGVLVLVVCASALTRDRFYPHGHGLDQNLPRGSEVPSPETALNVPIVFYGEAYDTIFVNNYGVLTFRADMPSFLNIEFPLPYPSIAAFYTNVDTTEQGSVFYRETNETHVLLKAEETVQNNFLEYYDFKPTSVFIATWLDVTYTTQDHKSTPTNSYQVAIISNGTESFAELLYPERDIQWYQKETQTRSLPDAKAQAGFVAEDGRMFMLRGSGSHQIRNIVSWSNTREPGKYVFRIGKIAPNENIAVPDQYDQHEIELEEESKTCAQSGPSVCHTQARCVDYQAGICCQCNEGFYGNGKTCIKNNLPLRIHGKINGVINNVNLNDVDIQAYVVVADGKAYTALSLVPAGLGSSLQLLNVLGGVVGWIFAKPSGFAKNGYQLTGAVFNHTADIVFPATGERVVINQEYLGQDVFDQITMETDIRGSIPELLTGVKLEIAEYEEQYTQIETGVIRSESSRVFINKNTGEKYEQRVSQTFRFNTCRFAPASPEDSTPLTLKVAKNYLGFESRENIVRYGMSNKIFPLGQEDPCIKGRSTCGPHTTCVAREDSYACVCETGFTESFGSSACIDIDECADRTHNCDQNADCYNYDGGFQCRCRPGYVGDGATCITSCLSIHCNKNARCVDKPEGAVCVCEPGFHGDGQVCYNDLSSECRPLHCPEDSRCLYSSEYNSHSCYPEVLDAGSAPLPPPLPSDDETNETYNNTFVQPHCVPYSCSCPRGYSAYVDEYNNYMCKLDAQSTPDGPPNNNQYTEPNYQVPTEAYNRNTEAYNTHTEEPYSPDQGQEEPYPPKEEERDQFNPYPSNGFDNNLYSPNQSGEESYPPYQASQAPSNQEQVTQYSPYQPSDAPYRPTEEPYPYNHEQEEPYSPNETQEEPYSPNDTRDGPYLINQAHEESYPPYTTSLDLYGPDQAPESAYPQSEVPYPSYPSTQESPAVQKQHTYPPSPSPPVHPYTSTEIAYQTDNGYQQSSESNDTITCNDDADCPPNAVCSYSNGEWEGKHCVCPEGYEGDAYECIERLSPACSCGVNAHCVNAGSDDFLCVCDPGYRIVDGYSCTPNFSCKNDTDCEYNAECKPDARTGENICQCVNGYIKDQNDACIRDAQLCNGASCAEHATCLYDYDLELNYCHCDDGYVGDAIVQCVPASQTCDVANDCDPNGDCVPVGSSYQCMCREGYTGDGYNCIAELGCRTDPNLCDQHASCQQRDDEYVCECNKGYNGNGSFCQLNPRQAGNFLVASDGASVYRVPFRATPWDIAIPFNSGASQIAVSVDVDCAMGWIYWGDVVSFAIKRTAYDGSGYELFMDHGVKNPEGLAVDWSSRNIFWTDSKKLTIEVANMDTKARKVLFTRDGISNPRGIAVHPQRGKIFWSDWNRANPKIEWANMDGTQRGVFLDKTEVALPNSLAIDWARDRLCYADAGLASIKCFGIDSLQKETVVSNCSYPFGLAISGDTFYWSDWKTLKIEYVNVLTQVRGQLSMATASRRLYGIAVAPDNCPQVQSVCAQWNGGCAHGQMCLPNGQGSRTCVDEDTNISYL